MPPRKSARRPAPPRPELERLLEQARAERVSDEELEEQRVSFIYGNAPENSGITKESARSASKSNRITRT